MPQLSKGEMQECLSFIHATDPSWYLFHARHWADYGDEEDLLPTLDCLTV